MQRKKNRKAGKITMFFEVVPYNNQNCLSVRLVCSLKGNLDGTSKPKTQLVTRGFEEENLKTHQHVVSIHYELLLQ